MQAGKETEAAVLATVIKWLDAYQSRDLETLMRLFIPDGNLVLIGTGADEKRIGPVEIRLQIERDYAQSEAILVELGWYSISAAGTAAWLAAECTFRVKASAQETVLPTRVTAILEQRGDQWLIAHWHVSVPAAGQIDGESW